MPDPIRLAQIKRNVSAIFQQAGQLATWRQFVSASAGSAALGLGTAHTYVQRPITGLFDPVRPQELSTPGGQFLVGDVWLTTSEPVTKRDEVVWEGNRYQAASEPVSVNLMGVPLNRTLIRRG